MWSYEQDFIDITGEIKTLQSTNNKLPDLLSKYVASFENVHDVGCINIEPHRIHLRSDHPISLAAYHTSSKEEEEIRE